MEIVVPIAEPDGRIVGAIDIDSDQPAAFGPEDRARVETTAAAPARLRLERAGRRRGDPRRRRLRGFSD